MSSQVTLQFIKEHGLKLYQNFSVYKDSSMFLKPTINYVIDILSLLKDGDIHDIEEITSITPLSRKETIEIMGKLRSAGLPFILKGGRDNLWQLPKF